jgi:anaerobic magnesium-protoporphyrin IX monomethyl ester cyclase
MCSRFLLPKMETSLSVDALVVQDLGQHKLSARYLVATLQHVCWRALLIDLNDGIDAIVTLAQRATPRLIVSSILFADRVNEHLALMTALRSVLPHAHLTIAGHLPTFAHADLLAACPALDSVMRGEEEEIARIISTLPLQARDTKPRVVLDALRIIPLDDLPFPARDDGIASYQGYGFATVEASRGCYHACAFCLPSAFHHAGGAPYRLRSIPNLVDEIESLYRRGARLFLFDDEQFLPPMSQRAERIASLADELERCALRIAFTIKCRADDANADAELFRRLQELGLVRVYVGIESGSQATLDLYNKRVTVEQNIEALRTLNDLGLVADFRAVIFHPWSTFEAIETEIEFLHRLSPWMSTAFDFRELEIYPGTPLARRMPKQKNAWTILYTITDPRAELLRRCSRLVFDPAGKYGDAHRSLTTAWFAHLLAQRFQPSASDTQRAHELKSSAMKMNGESLVVWREMLEFARDADIHDTNRVNEKASEWATKINQ